MTRADQRIAKNQIRLTGIEKWLLSPALCWKYLTKFQRLEDTQIHIRHIYEYGGRKLEERVVPTYKRLPSNYLSWFAQMEDEVLPGIPALIELNRKVSQARLYLTQYPLCSLYFSTNIFAPNHRTAKRTEVEIRRTQKHDKEKSLQLLKSTSAIWKKRATNLSDTITASDGTLSKLQRECHDRSRQGREVEPMDQGEENPITDIELHKQLRVALSEVTTLLVNKGIVSSAVKTFIVDSVARDKFDISILSPSDLAFLVNDTQIIRHRDVKGKLNFQLNNFE